MKRTLSSLRLRQTDIIGSGGEANIYRIPDGFVAKVYKSSADFSTKEEKTAARARLKEHQEKLAKLSAISLPGNILVPHDLIVRENDDIVGYTMPCVPDAEVLMKLSDKVWRRGYDSAHFKRLFIEIHQTVAYLHTEKVVIGDFNDLNILVRDGKSYFIDTDSFQFEQFLCRMFTDRFVDPLVCDPGQDSLMLSKPHNIKSDWYAFMVMYMQSTLFVGPYGGVHKPKTGRGMQHGQRVQNRVTVFDRDVIYPKPALHYDRLPDDLLEYLHKVFEKDLRGVPPIDKLLVDWKTCEKCGEVHARSVCPKCKFGIPTKTKVTVRGNVTAEHHHDIPGRIVYANVINGILHYVYTENGKVYIDGSSTEFPPAWRPNRIRILGQKLIVGEVGNTMEVGPGYMRCHSKADMFDNTCVFDVNSKYAFVADNGELLRTSSRGMPLKIGNVLANQTMFWVGEKMGFGFYRAGNVYVYFVFDPDARGIMDSVNLRGLIRGQLIDSSAVFDKDVCWFFVHYKDGNDYTKSVACIGNDGNVISLFEDWPHSIRGSFTKQRPGGPILYTATDDGIQAMDTNRRVSLFPDTEPFVDANTILLPGDNGIYAVDEHTITLLKIK